MGRRNFYFSKYFQRQRLSLPADVYVCYKHLCLADAFCVRIDIYIAQSSCFHTFTFFNSALGGTLPICFLRTENNSKCVFYFIFNDVDIWNSIDFCAYTLLLFHSKNKTNSKCLTSLFQTKPTIKNQF